MHRSLPILPFLIAALAGSCGSPMSPEEREARAAVTSPVEVDPSMRFVTVGAGHFHTCAVTTANELYCWGNGDEGQLGIDPHEECDLRGIGLFPCSGTPLLVPGVNGLSAIDGSVGFSCALGDAGRAWCWGFGLGGQLGDGTRISRLEPSRVSGEYSFSQLDVGFAAHGTCGISEGRLVCWGADLARFGAPSGLSEPSQVTDATAVQVAFSQLHMCLLDSAGHIACFGDNSHGKLGHGSAAEGGGLANSQTLLRVSTDQSFSAIAGGMNFTCALSVTGHPYCWGNMLTLSGVGSDRGTVPGPVPSAPELMSIYAGGFSACGLDGTGTAWCWGGNTFGALGDGTRQDRVEAAAAAGSLRFRQLAMGNAHVCGVSIDFRLFCWGDNSFGQVGRRSPFQR